MKVVILAAGLGSRLDFSTERLPKPLTKLANGKSILEFQLETLASLISLDQVFVVVGYQKKAIMDLFPELIYIYNPLFAVENTAKSLLRALRKIEEDVLWLNGDVVFHESVIQKILNFYRTGMVVNRTIVGEEEVKYRTDGQGRVLSVSKQVENPEGEALGINFYKREDLPILKKNLENCDNRDYFEKAIDQGIKEDQQEVWSIPVEVSSCAEIDFPEDLARVNHLLKDWS